MIKKKTIYFLLIVLVPVVSFSQTTARDSASENALKTLCDGYRIFEKCQVPVDFRYDKKTVEDSITNYLRGLGHSFQTGKATFQFVLAKDAKLYSIEKLYGNIPNDSIIIKALEQTAGLWTVGKQNSYLICSYVRVELEILEGRLTIIYLRK